jgi:hypothetical protein
MTNAIRQADRDGGITNSVFSEVGNHWGFDDEVGESIGHLLELEGRSGSGSGDMDCCVGSMGGVLMGVEVSESIGIAQGPWG